MFTFDQMQLDAQSALGFLTPAYYNLETTVYEIKYPEFNYARLVPVITEGNPWAQGTLFYTSDSTGQAKWQAGGAFDIPYADVNRQQLSAAFHMAAIGYEWNLEEVNRARMTGQDIGGDKARAARRVAEQFLWYLAMTGNTEKNMTGLLNDPNVTAADVPANGGGTSTFWINKTPAQILADINDGISGVNTGTNETEQANTVILPTGIRDMLASTQLSSGSDKTILNYLMENNSYTAETGQPLTIAASRALATADPGGDGRAVIYRRAPDVVRFHLPMPHQFLPPFQKASMVWEVAGIMRTGGTEVRLPKAIRYLDGIVDSTP